MPIFTAALAAVAAISAFTVGGIAVGSMLLQAAVGIGLNLLASAIAGKPKPPTFSINGTLQSGGDLPRSFIIGQTATAGSLVWANTWGNVDDTPNAFLTQVIAVSDLPVTIFDQLWVNGELCTLVTAEPHSDGRGYPVLEYRNGGTDNLWVKYYDGTQTAGDSFLVSCSNSGRSWGTTRVGYGVAYAILTARVTKNQFSGIPTFKFVVTGCPLYDITKDSTAGGSGSHRWSDPSTWGGDGDHFPAVQAYNLLRGLTYGGEWFYGLQGLSEARLPAANWIAQINKCRALIAGADGNEATYRSGGEISVDAPLAAAMEAINTTCQGRISEVGGTYSMYLGAPDDASFAFTDGDILSTEEQSFTPFFGLADTINGIFANYPSPDDGWTVKTAPPLYRTDLEALHGNRRLMADVSLDFVPYPEQVQRLMLSALLEGQRARRHTLVLPPEFWAYAVPGAICTLTSERNGYEAKFFRVDGVVDRANLDVMIDITEVDPADYDWDTEADYQEPVDGAVGPIRPAAQSIIDWSVAPSSVDDTIGDARRPAILLTWDNTAGRLDDVDGIEFEVRLAATSVTQYGGRTDQPEVGSLLISQGLLPNTLYGVRGRYIRNSGADVLWSDWLAVTTPDIRITDVIAHLEAMGDDVKEHLLSVSQDMDALSARQEQIALAVAEGAGVVASENSVAVQYRGATAVALQALSASITEIDGELTAVAEAAIAAEAKVDAVSAAGLFRVTTEATSAGAEATISLSVAATSGDDTQTAAILIDAMSDGDSRIILSADKILMADSVGTVSALFESGGVYINKAKIHDLDATNITALKLDAAEILQDGTLLTDLMAFGAVTEFADLSHTFTRSSGSSGGYDDGAFTTVATWVVDNPAATPMIEFVNLSLAGGYSGSGSVDLYIILYRDVISPAGIVAHALKTSNGGASVVVSSTTFLNDGATQYTYYLRQWHSVIGSGGYNISHDCESGVLFWKR